MNNIIKRTSILLLSKIKTTETLYSDTDACMAFDDNSILSEVNHA